MLARQSVERGLEHITAGGAAHAGVEPQCGLLLDRLPARFRVTLIKPALQESLEVRHLELFDHVPVARHGITDARQSADRLEYLMNRALQTGRDRRPSLREEGAGAVVDPVEGKPITKTGNCFGRGHGRAVSCWASIVADNGCPSINDLVTVGARKLLRRSAICIAARGATLPLSSSLIKKAGGRSPPPSHCADALRPTGEGYRREPPSIVPQVLPSTVSVTGASPDIPSACAAAGVMSITRPRTKGPRSLMRTTTERPVC